MRVRKDETPYGRYLGIWQGVCEKCGHVVIEAYSKERALEKAKKYKCETCEGPK